MSIPLLLRRCLLLRSAAFLAAGATLVGVVSPLTPANDGAASLAAGGIQLRKEARISMEKERLSISVRKITVEYEFRNNSKQDITTEVAFPIPEYSSTLDTFNAPPDFPDFRLWIDEQAIPPRTDVQALVKGVNKAEHLTHFGIDIVHFGGYEKYQEYAGEYQVLGLSEAAQRELLEAGLISGPDKKPAWTVHVAHYWTITFPAQKTVQVRHEYTPVTGQAQIPWDYFQSLESQKSAVPSNDSARIAAALTRQACFDTRNEKRRARPAQRPNLQLSTRDLATWGSTFVVIDFVEYILTTANTWKGPIKDFQLEVDTSNPWGIQPLLVNFCWDGPVQRLDNHHLSARKRDFVPKNELSVFFVRPQEPASN